MKTKILLLALLFITSCSTVVDPIYDDSEIISFETIVQSEQAFNNKGMVRVVIKNKEQEAKFLAENQPIISFPEIDYQKKMVVGIILDERPSCNIRLTIDAIVRYNNIIKVYSHEFHPLLRLPAISKPCHLVLIDKTELPIIFQQLKVIKESDPNLIYGKWYFRYFENVITGAKDLPPKEMREVTIDFWREGSFSGNGACNTYQGEFQIEDFNGIKITSLLSTLMACALQILNDWEFRYFTALQNVQKYSVNETELKLFFENYTKAIVFSRYNR